MAHHRVQRYNIILKWDDNYSLYVQVSLLHLHKRERIDAPHLVINTNHYHAATRIALCHHLATHVILVIASHPLLALGIAASLVEELHSRLFCRVS